MTVHRVLSHVGKIAVSAVALSYVLTRWVAWRSLTDAAQNIDCVWLGLAILVTLLMRWLLAVQYSLLARAAGPPPSVLTVMKAHFISSLFAVIAPGEIVSSGVSWHYLGRDRGNYALAGAVLIYLKLIAYAAIAILALLGVLLEPRLKAMNIPILAIGFIFACTAGTIPFLHGPTAIVARRMAEKISSIFPLGRWSQRIQQIPGRMLMLHELPTLKLLQPLPLTLIINILGAIGLGFTFKAAGVQVPWHACLWLRAVLIIVQAAPVSLAGTGVRELTLVFLLRKLFDSPSVQVVVASLLILAMNIFFGLIIGGTLFVLDRGRHPLATIPDKQTIP